MEGLIQNQDLVYLIYIGLALGVFLVFTGLAQALSRTENTSEARSRRMRMINKGATTAEVLALLKPDPKGGPLSGLPFLGDLPGTLRRAGLAISPSTFLLICAALAGALFAVAFGFLGPLPAALVALAGGVVAPMIFVQMRRKQRSEALIRQLPDTLDLLARGLRVGHPLNATINSVAREMPDPIGTEFGLIFDQVSYGDDLVDAFAEFAERVDVEDVHYLSASIGIQHGTGGDLARVIEMLAKVVRGRIAMRQKIHAISSEGRLSATILSLLPLGMFMAISTLAPSYYRDVADDPAFLPLAITVVALIATNYLVLKRLVNFRI